ncbi:5-formyltetrahydrofolate cyclo-ligase [Ferrimonas balearica]|uniref:5-formyltetrahydrofolate cyclo-ligase n=1 Tax=Ferrimonas balearica TaxID=44012 RepID=UPI001C570D3D|nr:5-formyltetrahydrofolate cyclo-ligase [Ferrimonas balearica]MBW3140638.1 5-formyltetrahydrofolate cyclo-ligase [Ferrimonas balearica]MBY6107557.1 5-formyltetrahydrofolate cyclo-ligase [Ferrimonas balearica]
MSVDTLSRAACRHQLRQARRALSPEQQKQAAIGLARHLPDHTLVQHAQSVALYIANDGELDPHLLAEVLHTRGKRLALPVLHPFHSQHLLFLEFQPGQPMRTNRYGIPEPDLDKTRVVPMAELDLILLPLVGFDNAGNRMGMGGGFYDRTLGCLDMGARPQLIGLAHECQRVDQLPVAPWDVPMDAIATAEGLIDLAG